jgi:regulatory protein YycI of two-component signal transduction system YycFG
MNVMDAVSILKGSDSAATQYLRQTTVTSLNSKFRPVIENSLKKVDATKHWASLINAYNKISLKKINPDLTGYVTEKAINGIFYQIAEEEKKIRRDPLARNTELLKKVFGNVSKQMLMP